MEHFESCFASFAGPGVASRLHLGALSQTTVTPRVPAARHRVLVRLAGLARLGREVAVHVIEMMHDVVQRVLTDGLDREARAVASGPPAFPGRWFSSVEVACESACGPGQLDGDRLGFLVLVVVFDGGTVLVPFW